MFRYVYVYVNVLEFKIQHIDQSSDYSGCFLVMFLKPMETACIKWIDLFCSYLCAQDVHWPDVVSSMLWPHNSCL